MLIYKLIIYFGGSPRIYLHDLKLKKHCIFFILYILQHVFSSSAWNVLVPVSLSPPFRKAHSALIGQLAQSVLTGQQLKACVRNVTSEPVLTTVDSIISMVTLMSILMSIRVFCFVCLPLHHQLSKIIYPEREIRSPTRTSTTSRTTRTSTILVEKKVIW